MSVTHNEKDTCKNCIHWMRITMIKPDKGDCRCYPPTVHAIEHTITTAWPITKEGDWCGKFENY